ncbi:MAG TPA: FkbM family methyltransferase [Candidatus Acidoferrum sp.]|nr:FkbM family methyltransferase [Candidatus Acidoferrum sp.]
MGATRGRLAQFVLRHEFLVKKVRGLPFLGKIFSGIGVKLVPRDVLTWAQVQYGPAQGLWLSLHPRTGTAYFEGRGEPEVQEALRRHLQPGMTFYDVGANIGFFTVLAARLVGANGRVVAFEADPEIAERLRGHKAKNAFDCVTVEEKAVWSESGPVQFARANPSASPERGLGHVVVGPEADTIPANGVSLDDYAKTAPPPDFLKCDVEGAEVEVFRGAAGLLKDRRPGIICEMHSEENHRILLEEFTRLGYNCTACGTNHILALPR